MQVGFVVNPRRSPRAPARCRAAVVSGAGVFQVETEDVGAQGCQLLGAHLLRSGERVLLEISNDLVTGALRVGGRIAWVSGAAGGRAGVSYEAPALPRSREWFERLVASHPGVGAFRRVPERIAANAMVYLGPPPRCPADLSPDELLLLRAVGDGVPVRALVSLAGVRWPAMQRSFYALLARQLLTLLARLAAPASAWTAVISGAERPSPPAPPPPEAHVAAPAARPAQAQQCFERARAELDLGHASGALALLRMALSLAPGDAEIKGALGKLAFSDRWSQGR